MEKEGKEKQKQGNKGDITEEEGKNIRKDGGRK